MLCYPKKIPTGKPAGIFWVFIAMIYFISTILAVCTKVPLSSR